MAGALFAHNLDFVFQLLLEVLCVECQHALVIAECRFVASFIMKLRSFCSIDYQLTDKNPAKFQISSHDSSSSVTTKLYANSAVDADLEHASSFPGEVSAISDEDEIGPNHFKFGKDLGRAWKLLRQSGDRMEDTGSII